jgi:hypothetical protein
MELEWLKALDIQNIGFVAMFSFGSVAAINFKWKLSSGYNFLLCVAFAIAFGFVPADLGNVILNKVRDGIAIAVSLNGVYQALGNTAKKIGGT